MLWTVLEIGVVSRVDLCLGCEVQHGLLVWGRKEGMTETKSKVICYQLYERGMDRGESCLHSSKARDTSTTCLEYLGAVVSEYIRCVLGGSIGSRVLGACQVGRGQLAR